MAPRGGSRGGSGGSGGSVCPGAFTDGTSLAYFVVGVLFWFALLAIFIIWLKVRKNNPKSKRLIGPFFAFGVAFIFIAMTMQNVTNLLMECGSIETDHYWRTTIAINIFYRIAYYFLLIVVVWGLNVVLRDRLGTYPFVYKFVINVVLGVMALLTVAYMGMYSYYTYVLFDGFGEISELIVARFSVAYWVLYLVSIFIGGALAIASSNQLRSCGNGLGSTFTLIIAMLISMTIWVMFIVIDLAITIGDSVSNVEGASMAFYYIIKIFHAISYLLILLIAKSTVWKTITDNTLYVANQAYAPVPQHKSEYPTEYSNAPPVVPPYSNTPQADPQQSSQYPFQADPQQYVYPHGQAPAQQQTAQLFYYPQQQQPQPQLQPKQGLAELAQGHQK